MKIKIVQNFRNREEIFKELQNQISLTDSASVDCLIKVEILFEAGC